MYMNREEWVDAVAQANASGWHLNELARRINKSPAGVADACKRHGLTLRWKGQKGRPVDQQQPQEVIPAGLELADKLARLDRQVQRLKLLVDAQSKRIAHLEGQ